MIAFVFPGQASQFVGMGRSWAESSNIAAKYMDRANEVLGRDLKKTCFEGPEVDLTDTRNQQPAIYVVSCMASALLKEEGVEPGFVAGHSVGEYAALYAAGVFDFESGLQLVQARADAMAETAAAHPGTMAAVIRLDRVVIEASCAEIESNGEGILSVAGYNSPDQTVISGTREMIEEAQSVLKEKGAKRVLPLSVSGAFHSALMTEARVQLEEAIEEVDFAPPKIPFVSNNTAKPEADPSAIKVQLAKQLVSPVRWVETMEFLKGEGVEACIEAGPGKVLQGLFAKFNPDWPCESLTDFASIQETAGKYR
ncbi:MAG: ACP S-malonyltransferase [Candidatus Omnitrophica bacterium]|nr:ACP S-malonyltransferase [Candidatus Omnitrophota bacterium]